MSKLFKSIKAVAEDILFGKKFAKHYEAGQRIWPTKLQKKDDKFQVRIDAGPLVGDKRQLKLQINSNPSNQALKDTLAADPRGTHGVLSTTWFDTKAPDIEGEGQRAVHDLLDKGLKILK